MTDSEKKPWRWRRPVWLIVKVVSVLLIAAAVAYWLWYSPVGVEEHPVQTGTIVAEVLGTGTLEARVAAVVSPTISGRIAKVLTDQGDQVSQGDLLIELDDEELQQQVDIAKANVEAADAAIVRLKTDKERANAVFEQAKRTQARLEQLLRQSATSQEEYESAAESLAVAIADVARSEAAISEAQKQLLAAEKTLEYHRARLQDTQIVAPFDGLIIDRHRESGDVVVPGSSVLSLVSTDVLWVSAWVDETAMSQVAVGQPTRVVFRSKIDTAYPGQVARLGKEADRETREFIVDVQVLELPTEWAIGQRAEVFIETARAEDVLMLPTRLLVDQEGTEGVFVNDNGHARWQPLQIGLRSRDHVEVLDGLSASDMVITPTSSNTSLTTGRRVRKTE